MKISSQTASRPQTLDLADQMIQANTGKTFAQLQPGSVDRFDTKANSTKASPKSTKTHKAHSHKAHSHKAHSHKTSTTGTSGKTSGTTTPAAKAGGVVGDLENLVH